MDYPLTPRNAQALLTIIPEEDKAYGRVRWLLQLYLDWDMSAKDVGNIPTYQAFCVTFSAQIWQLFQQQRNNHIRLFLPILEKKIASLRQDTIRQPAKQRRNKHNITPVYTAIRLYHMSGLTVLSRQSINDIEVFLWELLENTQLVKPHLKEICKLLKEYEFYRTDDSPCYEISLLLSSEGSLGLGITLTEAEENNASFIYTLHTKRECVADAICRVGYFDDHTKDTFEPRYETGWEEDDDDDLV